MNVVVIIQARMGSTRLPGKMMMEIAGKPIIEHVVDHLRLARFVNEIWLATTTKAEDDVLAAWAKKQRVFCFRGSSEDVLDRYLQTAREAKADVVVRITGDCPLIDPEVVDLVVGEYFSGDFDYVCNTQPPTFPDGLDTEVFALSVLERTWREARLASEREHVTPYIWKHPEIFKIKNVIHIPDLSAERWTLDTNTDLEFIRRLFEECAEQKVFGHLEELLSILAQHPDWRAINNQYKRNEGYARSLQNDKLV